MLEVFALSFLCGWTQIPLRNIQTEVEIIYGKILMLHLRISLNTKKFRSLPGLKNWNMYSLFFAGDSEIFWKCVLAEDKRLKREFMMSSFWSLEFIWCYFSIL